MIRRLDTRPAVALLTAVAIAVGLSACGSSDASSDPTVPVSAPAVAQPAATVPTVAQPAVTQPATTAPVVTTAAAPAPTVPAPAATEAPGATMSVTDAEVADLEKQLDEIDQLLAGVDADLKQD